MRAGGLGGVAGNVAIQIWYGYCNYEYSSYGYLHKTVPQHPVIDRGGVCESPPLPKELLAVNSCCRGVLLFFKGVATGELAEKKKWYRGN